MFNRIYNHYYEPLPPSSYDTDSRNVNATNSTTATSTAGIEAVGRRPTIDSIELGESGGDVRPAYKFEYASYPRQSWSARYILTWNRFCGRTGPFGRLRRVLIRCVLVFVLVVMTLLVVTPIWNPSYTYKPKHYSGTNPRGEKVFIAANIIDKDLINGPWGEAVLGLIDIIGPQNAFLSIYENDSGQETKEALRELAAKVKCEYLRIQIEDGC
jgi:hypothetical protein